MTAQPRFRRARIIYNPGSGQGPRLPLLLRTFLGLRDAVWAHDARLDPHERLRLVQAALGTHGIPSEAFLTVHHGDGARLAREAVAAGCDLVVAVGGDGTLNEVVNGLAGSDTALGVIPAGTINLFALQLGLPTDVEGACRAIALGTVRSIDLGRVDLRYFLSVAGVGFDAYVIRVTGSRLKRAAGAVSLAWVALRRFFTYPFRRIRFTVDDDPRVHRGYFLVVGNGKYYAGDLRILPQADLADGLLDVCVFKRKALWNVLGYLWGLRWGTLEKYLDVEHFQCRKLAVARRGRHAVHADAEVLGRTPVTIQVAPAALRVVMPPDRTTS